MRDTRAVRPLPRGRIAKRSKQQPARLGTPEPPGPARAMITRGRAFAMHGVMLRSRLWSRGGVRDDGAVVLAVMADEMQKAGDAESYLLWAPNLLGSRPWSDTPGGMERLEHCRIALERGAAEGLLTYGKRAAGAAPKDDGTSAERVDSETLLSLRVEKRGEEYWASCAAPKPAAGSRR